ncbi:hypothetical protein GLOIN_2v1488317 [Rhizophagus clarus]|uniref:Uncharacterized protein n=1 Tax=Rhizophagus clarus TaxID=94130 RepID=A0A8H3L2U3_9GLOM|nr:hypothetical protein GLOIN_2v1488317 [Rhizophagus clarus]
MHHLDLGLFRYQIIFTCDILKSQHVNVMIFVIDNLYDENNNEVDNFVNNDDLTKLYEYWNEMYILSRYEEFSKSDLKKFNDAIHRWTWMFVKAFKFVSPSNLNNKKDVEPQLLRTIKRQAISIRMSQHSVNSAKIPHTYSVDNKMQTGFARFISCLDSYLDLLDGFTIIDKGLCYGQALLLAEVLTDPPLNLALIQYYRVYTWCRSHSTPI